MWLCARRAWHSAGVSGTSSFPAFLRLKKTRLRLTGFYEEPGPVCSTPCHSVESRAPVHTMSIVMAREKLCLVRFYRFLGRSGLASAMWIMVFF